MAIPSFSRNGFRFFFLVAALGAVQTVDALCLDEKGVSGYHVPLVKEMRGAEAIVLGRVTREKDLFEDPADPRGVTAMIYTLQITRVVRGKAPTIVRIRSENDSSRFWMAVGEEYLLFLSRDTQHRAFYFVDSCGNSGVASKQAPVLHQVER